MSAPEPVVTDFPKVNSELVATAKRLQAENSELAQANEALRENEARLRMILQQAPIMLFSRDSQGRYQIWNNECERQLKMSLGEVNTGVDPLALFYPDPEIREAVSEVMRRGDGQFREYSVRTVTGEQKTHRWAYSSLPSGDTFAVGYDVTNAREREALLELAVRELGHRNEALDNFATTVCHDLQEPLRMVSGYVRLLLDEYGDQIGDEANRFIEFAAEGAERMTQMTRGLLSLARVGNHDIKALEELAVADVVDEAMANLAASIDSCNADIQVLNLPRLLTIRPLLAQIFLNLIGNAIKFCRYRPPQIRIGACLRDEEWVFTVQDNGIGINRKDHKRIFQVFQRLNRHACYPGAGVGLALVKRSVESLGGSIWLESEVDQGTTFFFTLPRNPKKIYHALTKANLNRSLVAKFT